MKLQSWFKHVIIHENPKKKHNWIREPSITCSHIWHIDMYNICTLFKNTICKCLLKMKYFRRECSSIVYKKPKERNKIQEAYSYIWLIDTSKYAYWLDTRSVEVWWSYVLPNSNAVNFCDIIFRHRAMFLTWPNK